MESSRYLQAYAPHPNGHALALTVRGKSFTMANWEEAVLQHGVCDGVRYRLTQWLNDGKHLVTVSDADGEEAIEIHTRDGSADPVRLAALDIGRPIALLVSPKKDQIIVLNHRFELLFIDLESQKLRQLDKSQHDQIRSAAWSPDGRWIAYDFPSTETTRSIQICKVETGETWLVTPPEFTDIAPAWDPEGKYLYFLSFREFNPVYDSFYFDLGFLQAMRLLLVTLQKDQLNPFIPEPRPLNDEKTELKENESDKEAEKTKKSEKQIEIDFEDITHRVVAFPYPQGSYKQIAGIEGKAIFTSFPMEHSLRSSGDNDNRGPKGTLHVCDFKEQKKDTLVSGIDEFELSRDNKTLVYRAGDRLRAIKAGAKPDDQNKSEGDGGPNRRSGWLDLNRVKTSVVPTAEWRQMYQEAWRLQRDYFWTADMSGVNWEQVYQRYLPLLERIATRAEFSDLMWEMQGELGTSHAYESGGDYRASPNYAQGFLGADFAYDAKSDGYRITHIVHGDAWEEMSNSPLNEPGLNIHEGGHSPCNWWASRWSSNLSRPTAGQPLRAGGPSHFPASRRW